MAFQRIGWVFLILLVAAVYINIGHAVNAILGNLIALAREGQLDLETLTGFERFLVGPWQENFGNVEPVLAVFARPPVVVLLWPLYIVAPATLWVVSGTWFVFSGAFLERYWDDPAEIMVSLLALLASIFFLAWGMLKIRKS